MPLAPRVLEVADQFLLLGVDGDDRHTALDAVLGLGVDVLELRVAIRVLGAVCSETWCFFATSATGAASASRRIFTMSSSVNLLLRIPLSVSGEASSHVSCGSDSPGRSSAPPGNGRVTVASAS
jgi:hypothetical protein